MKTKRRSSPPESSSSPIISMAEAQDSSTLSPLHHNDLIKDILSRLPIKSIKRFESVSKLWYSLINSDDFISAHLRRTSRRPLLLIHRFHNPTGSNFTISLVDSRSPIPRDVRVPFLGSLVRYPKIVGSCNGILCLDVSPCYSTAFVLWNVGSRGFRFLPRPMIDGGKRGVWMVGTGFGFDRETNDYKLLRIVNFRSGDDDSRLVMAEVFSWSTGSWRLIDGRMTSEELGSCVIHEAYAGSGRPMNRIELWVLEEVCRGNEISKLWKRLHSVDLTFPGTPIGVYNDTDLLIKRVDSHYVALSFYDPYSETLKNLHICGSDFTCEFFSYVDSLVPVKNAGDEHMEEEAEVDGKE
ncbi:F-box and associated interaction domains-containing protein [Euphorbia peplus]|nr:F-box and associated interaction domains-containing protein [Euphorbia peplus]